MLAICPHMHLLGESYKVWMETPQGDSIPLIDIPDWQFRWQFYYNFQSPQYFPAGSVLKSIGQYDNTVNNPDNPNDPPETVYDGGLTTDEMFLCYFIYADYQPGDEELILDPDLITSVEDLTITEELAPWPNPTSSQLQLNLPSDQYSELSIYSSHGQLVQSEVVNGRSTIDVSSLSTGFYSIIVRNDRWIRKSSFIKR